jgi:hypothetical protein
MHHEKVLAGETFGALCARIGATRENVLAANPHLQERAFLIQYGDTQVRTVELYENEDIKQPTYEIIEPDDYEAYKNCAALGGVSKIGKQTCFPLSKVDGKYFAGVGEDRKEIPNEKVKYISFFQECVAKGGVMDDDKPVCYAVQKADTASGTGLYIDFTKFIEIDPAALEREPKVVERETNEEGMSKKTMAILAVGAVGVGVLGWWLLT